MLCRRNRSGTLQFTLLLQLSKLKSESAQKSPSSAGATLPPSVDDVALLRQRVAELERLLSDANAVANGEQSGLFFSAHVFTNI